MGAGRKAGVERQKAELEVLREVGVVQASEAFGGNLGKHHIEDRSQDVKRKSWEEAMDDW